MPTADTESRLREVLAGESLRELLDRWDEPQTAGQRAALREELDSRGYRMRALDPPPPDVTAEEAARIDRARAPRPRGARELALILGALSSGVLASVLGLGRLTDHVLHLLGFEPAPPDPRFEPYPSALHAYAAGIAFALLGWHIRRDTRWAAPAALTLFVVDRRATAFMEGELGGNMLIVFVFAGLMTATLASFTKR